MDRMPPNRVEFLTEEERIVIIQAKSHEYFVDAVNAIISNQGWSFKKFNFENGFFMAMLSKKK